MVHFDPSLPIGVACDASNVGIGATLFHRFTDGSERPIANISKTLTPAQRNYSQIQKEGLSIVYALTKFYQFLYGRNFILVTDHKPLLAIFGSDKPTPRLAANRLSRWALFLNQFSYHIEYRKTTHHQNADALSRLPASEDTIFDSEESTGDEDIVCAIDTLERQIKSADSSSMPKETLRDPVLSLVMRFTREGWPICKSRDDPFEAFRKISDSLSSCYDCLLYGTRVVIPSSLRKHVLELLHKGHFGIQRMKQLARTAVYWPNIDIDITDMCQRCSTCAVHQPLPSKASIHPWMVPEKPWSRLHIDHAINFMGCNWLVMIDSHSKYPCIHPTSSVSSISTMRLLESDFAHFGYPHTLVSDNSTSFMSDEFQLFCKERGIVHLTGAPYHPATNGAAERLVRTFKQALTKSSKPPKEALQEFLMMYRRTPTACGFSPSELLNSRQIRTKIDTLVVSPLQIPSNPCKVKPEKKVVNVINDLNVGDPVYTLCFRPHRSHDPRWVPGIILKKRGERQFLVQ